MPAGPPKGNLNALKTGCHATTSLEKLTGRHAPAFQTAKLPEGLNRITRKLNALRKTIEGAVFAAKGEIDIVDAATIQTIVRAECHARLCSRWLLDEAATLTVDQKANLSRECHRASVERDKAIRSLDLRRKAQQGIKDALRTLTARVAEPSKEQGPTPSIAVPSVTPAVSWSLDG